ncbi:histidine kinase [Salipiger aestuarii]|uniref:Two-component sensor histidine kinase n=1 Tax=Salipiger aestuarii TaxID=568098 RepID=A0A327YIS3_9RHOB|nr:histidine kinase dimerization/phosphoacceptor domain -containing protein [Salipiger aestuarii]EIE52235.1 signal transduction histidine kinase [Citreicella sp. 357]KAA8609102.1 histidine kinase [Salipiger aestuarii]KAA8614303.1 histidine kinase [Salipiger aestuarii]KAB2542792.1 histidine kinase [Salipiger aestuarii]RAK20262.1 two-component sensor histidine kinase [Salipiger aestuarii]
MAVAPKASNEEERLSELHSFGVLDAAPDPAFDEVVDLLATMLEVPVVLISLVDAHRQWFRARHGFVPSETPLNQSICSHAILEDGILEIEDTLLDLRSADNPLCCGLTDNMRFYAGAPLITRSGHRIGTLCVLDTRPRRLTPPQRQLLEVMGRQVMRQLDLERALRNKEILREEIDHRVKNSLQTVASTIRLYRGRTRSEDAREALDAVARRVDAISQLHAELNLTSKMHHLRLDSYLDRVSQLLQRNAPADARFEIDAAPIEVDSRVATALGVIANEFAANSAKYALAPDGLIVRFELTRVGPNRMQFVCRDNGIARHGATEVDVLSSTSLGARLMEAAAAQVSGTLSEGRVADGFELRAELPINLGAGAEAESGQISPKMFAARGVAPAAE